MIRLAGNGAKRQVDITDLELLSHQFKRALHKIIALAKTSQILHGHLARQMRPVTIPVKQVKGRRGLAHHIAAHRRAVDQILGAQKAKGLGHIFVIKHTIFGNLPFDGIDKIILQKDRKFTLIGKIRQRGEEGGR